MSIKSKEKLKRLWRRALKGALSKTAYCIYVEKKHRMEYRSTVQRFYNMNGSLRVHINSCSNCGLVKAVDC